MPVTKSAAKKNRQDKKRMAQNKIKKRAIKEALKKVVKNPTPQNLSLAYSLLDKAQKTGLFLKNKAARLKSRLAKLVAKKGTKEKMVVSKKSVTKKPAPKSKKKITKSPKKS